MEKWLYREQANYRLTGSENAYVIQCAMGNKFVWIGSISRLSSTDYRVMRVPVHQGSYDKLEPGRFSSEEAALNWIIDQAEPEISQTPQRFKMSNIPKHPVKELLP
jgi:hypothetical protein